MNRFVTTMLALWIGLSTGSMSQAAFHLWKFSEFFSNADGSVQFIEMHNAFAGENFVQGVQIQSLSTGKTFTFPANLPPGSTADTHMLIATAGFGSLPGAATPDYTLPSTSFFNPAGDTISFVAGGFTYDSRTFPFVPTDGVNSRHFPPNTIAINSPTNFAGHSGSVDVSALAGDHNGDGVVDAADYVLWRKTGVGGPQGYIDWRANFGAIVPGSGGGTSFAVPEPPTIVLALALLALAFGRRTRQFAQRTW